MPWGVAVEFLVIVGFVAAVIYSRRWSKQQERAAQGPAAPAGRPVRLPPPSGQPVDRQPYVYAVYSTEGREGWPTPVLNAVRGIFDLASADEPATLAKMRSLARKATNCAFPVLNHLEPLLDGLEDDYPYLSALEDLMQAAQDLDELADQAADAEDAFEVDVIAAAQEFVDLWLAFPKS